MIPWEIGLGRIQLKVVVLTHDFVIVAHQYKNDVVVLVLQEEGSVEVVGFILTEHTHHMMDTLVNTKNLTLMNRSHL